MVVNKGRLALALSALLLLLAACPNPYFDRVKEVVDAAKAPRMALTAASVSLATGGSYDFGSVPVGFLRSAIFTITNNGKTDLVLSGGVGVSIGGANPTEFTMPVSPGSSVISAGKSTTFTLAFVPASVGPKSATVTVASNDPAAGSYSFTVTGNWSAEAPTFSPAPGTYSLDQNVTLSSLTVGAVIHYTTDGTSPTVGSPVFSIVAPIPVHGNGTTVTIKTYAAAAGLADSAVITGTFTINTSAVSTPNFSPAGGPYAADQNVTISCATVGAVLYYTIDGTNPSTSSLTSQPIPVAGNGASRTIKALAHLAGYTDSTAQASYTITYPTAFPPVPTPGPGVFNMPLSVTFANVVPLGQSIRYTTDGSTPSSTVGTVYVSAIPVPVSTTIRALAYGPAWTDSLLITLPYTLQPLPPVLNPAGGSYPIPTLVTITCTTPSVSIRYTTDGSAPTSTNGTLIASGNTVLVSASSSLKAIAYLAGWTDSPVTTGTFTINSNPPPTFDFPGGRLGNTDTIGLTATGGAQIAYTLDGSTPASNGSGGIAVGTSYAGAFVPPYGTFVVKAIAYKAGWGDSAVVSQSYHKDIFVYSLGALGQGVDVFLLDPATGALSHTSTFGLPNQPAGMSADSNGTLMFVTSPTANMIWGFTIDPATGALTTNGMPMSVINPGTIHVRKSNDIVYVADADALIHTYQIGAGGALTLVGTADASIDPVAIVSDLTNKVVFAADAGSAVISAYTVNAGLLTPAATPYVITGGAPADVIIDPTNTYLYETDGSGNSVRGYTWDASGLLTPLPIASFPALANPTRMAIEPTGKYLYIIYSPTGQVEVFQIAAGTGNLTGTGFYSTGALPSRIRVDPSGKFVLVTNSGENSISVFSINAANGLLTLKGTYSTPTSDPEDLIVTGTP